MSIEHLHRKGLFIMRSFIKTCVASTSLAFLVTACASSQPVVESSAAIPEWVSHPQSLYPETRYLVAVGNGNNRNDAIRDGKKNLAESFMVKVQSETKTHAESSMAQDTSGSVSGKTDQNINKDLSLSTETYLRGAEVKEVYEGKETFALIALDKMKARSGLLMEAQKSQAKLDQLYDLLKEQYTSQKWNEAQDELKKFDQLYSEAAALGMGALVNSNDYIRKFGQMDLANRGKMKKIIFTVELGDGEQFIQNDIEQCITERGGTIYASEKAPVGANKLMLDIVERPQHYSVAGWTKIRFDLTASVTQPDGKKYRIQTSKTEIGRTKDAVMESASDELSKEFCDKLFSRMGEM